MSSVVVAGTSPILLSIHRAPARVGADRRVLRGALSPSEAIQRLPDWVVARTGRVAVAVAATRIRRHYARRVVGAILQRLDGHEVVVLEVDLRHLPSPPFALGSARLSDRSVRQHRVGGPSLRREAWAGGV